MTTKMRSHCFSKCWESVGKLFHTGETYGTEILFIPEKKRYFLR
jgi:hypothetical protein